ncbi:galactoside 2-alpha-l-fucosyltransferase [Quercus suber]|uniref:Fucosyltransferase n=1 Tax=Quercus suber TaxID=58331 RepID=A0AAW0LF57_QUESU
MYLLSLTDVLVTSAWSTFGYVAQDLGGLKPWILYKSENQTTPNPLCCQAMSMEPCFHAPPFYDCKKKKEIDNGPLVPHVRHCEDMS